MYRMDEDEKLVANAFLNHVNRPIHDTFPAQSESEGEVNRMLTIEQLAISPDGLPAARLITRRPPPVDHLARYEIAITVRRIS